MTLEDALLGQPVKIKTLDGRVLLINLDQSITPQLVHKVPGEGMPRKANSQQRGDLYLKFDILFPKKINTEERNKIIAILEE